MTHLIWFWPDFCFINSSGTMMLVVMALFTFLDHYSGCGFKSLFNPFWEGFPIRLICIFRWTKTPSRPPSVGEIFIQFTTLFSDAWQNLSTRTCSRSVSFLFWVSRFWVSFRDLGSNQCKPLKTLLEDTENYGCNPWDKSDLDISGCRFNDLLSHVRCVK